MARKSQSKRQDQAQAGGGGGGQYPTHHLPTAGNGRASAVEELVAPTFCFPFEQTYTAELEVSDCDSKLESASESTAQNTAAQDQAYLNTENQTPYWYAPIARPWDQRSQALQGTYDAQNQTAFGVWESQNPSEEPFHAVGEVAVGSVGPGQGGGCDVKPRRGKRQKKVGL